MEKILLHACCAPCASYPISKLLAQDIVPVVFFYNPNIYPLKEYEIRRDELRKYCKKLNVEYIEGEYDIKEYYDIVKGLENEPEKGKRSPGLESAENPKQDQPKEDHTKTQHN